MPTIQADRQVETFPGARIEKLEGLGHWALLETPERDAEHVVPFLCEHVRPGGSPAGTDQNLFE